MPYTAPNPLPYKATAGTDASAQYSPLRKYPLPEQCPTQFDGYAFDQRFEMLLSSYPPAPRNTKSTAAAFGLSDANAILTRLQPPNPTGAGMGEFTAEFSIVPASWDDFSKSISFQFPGFPGIIGSTSRNPFTQVVPVRERRDYYVVDPDGILTGSGVVDSGGSAINLVASMSAIPLVQRSQFVVANGGTADYSNPTQSIVKAGGDNINGVTWYETLPTLAAYKSLISNASANGWSSTVWGGTNTVGTAGQLVLEMSTLEPYAGNIIARVTRYVLAQ